LCGDVWRGVVSMLQRSREDLAVVADALTASVAPAATAFSGSSIQALAQAAYERACTGGLGASGRVRTRGDALALVRYPHVNQLLIWLVLTIDEAVPPALHDTAAHLEAVHVRLEEARAALQAIAVDLVTHRGLHPLPRIRAS
jgi:hypothetical protein